MTKYTFRYTETYEGFYEVEAESIEEAEEILRNDISTGKREGPDECCGSEFDIQWIGEL